MNELRSVRQLLDPVSRSIPLLGREAELAALCDWLHLNRAVAVQTIVGIAGAGKTRLAAELVAEASPLEPNGWETEFVDGDDLERLARASGESAESWRRPRLLVADQAAFNAGQLREFLGAVAPRITPPRGRLRLLLLARHASREQGWLRYLQTGLGQWFEPLAPVILPDLADPSVQARLGQEILRLASTLNAGPPAEHGAETILPLDDNAALGPADASPVSLVMAGILAALTGVPPASLCRRTKIELAFALADLELDRLNKLAPDANPAERVWLAHLAACSIMLDESSVDALTALVQDEQRALPFDCGASTDVVAECLAEILPARGCRPGRVAPDLVGAALVLRVLGRDASGRSGRQILLRLARRKPRAVTTFVARVADDFAGILHPEPLEWIGLMLGADVALDPGWLLEADAVTPLGTTGLRKLTAQISCGIVAALHRRASAAADDPLAPELARVLGRLSARLADSGAPEAALEKARETERLCRTLAQQQPLEHWSRWASALEALALRLSERGQLEEALAAAEQAEAMRRVQATTAGDLWTPEPELWQRILEFGTGRQATRTDAATTTVQPAVDRGAVAAAQALARLARTLQVTAIVLGRARKVLEARVKVEEAAGLYRRLALELPERFGSELADARSHLAVLLLGGGEPVLALSMAREAEDVARACLPRCPNASRARRACSLGCLAHHLEGCGLYAETTSCAEEAAAIWRTLAKTEPAAFAPDLGRSLVRLAMRWIEGDRLEDARSALAEAEVVFDQLGRIDPGGFLPPLAVTLSNQACVLGAVGQWTTALEKAERAEAMLELLAEAEPATFQTAWAKSLAVKGTCYRSLGRPTEALEQYGRALIVLTPWYRHDAARFSHLMDSVLRDLVTVLHEPKPPSAANDRDSLAASDG